jgi:hypothetical protein
VSQTLVADARASRITKITHPAFPPGIETWEKGLTGLRLSDQSNSSRAQTVPRLGFQSPDITIFLNDGKRHLYLAMWLLCRVPHVGSCAVDATAIGVDKSIWESMPRITKEQWRTFLFRTKRMVSDPSTPSNPSSLTQETPTEAQGHIKSRTVKHPTRTLSPYLDSLIDLQQTCKTIFWLDCEHSFETEEDLRRFFTNERCSEVLWEVSESNFRFELMFLDMVLAQDHWMDLEGETPGRAAAHREQQLLRIFPKPSDSLPDSYLVTAMPNRDVGLAADHWRGRENALHGMYHILSSWPSFPPSIVCYSNTSAATATLEASLIQFYCQSFYDTFGRVPTCPRKIPASSRKRGRCIPFIEAAARAADAAQG